MISPAREWFDTLWAEVGARLDIVRDGAPLFPNLRALVKRRESSVDVTGQQRFAVGTHECQLWSRDVEGYVPKKGDRFVIVGGGQYALPRDSAITQGDWRGETIKFVVAEVEPA